MLVWVQEGPGLQILKTPDVPLRLSGVLIFGVPHDIFNSRSNRRQPCPRAKNGEPCFCPTPRVESAKDKEEKTFVEQHGTNPTRESSHLGSDSLRTRKPLHSGAQRMK
jgi:hypothetical protein